MKILVLAVVIGLVVAPNVAAVETSPPLQLKTKAALVTATPQHNYAPFIVPAAHEPVLNLMPRDLRLDESRSSCNSHRALCYDVDSGHIVYKPARQLMPDVPGLQRENISVKRDKVVLRYSF